MEVRYSRLASRALRRSGKGKLLRAKIEQLASRPETLSANINKLTGKSEFRLRVQDFRVIFRMEGSALEIDDTLPRSEAYRRQ